MKLRNKQTGEIADFSKGNFISSKDYGFVIYKDGGRGIEYSSLAELTEEWEDYEEPKEYWYIRDFSITRGDTKCIGYSPEPNSDTAEYRKQIGNYFETKEEAEKAVEKLKAWKRLKDKDFQFHGHNALGVGEITFSLDFEDMDDEGEIGQLRHDLDLLFSGEND